MIHIIKTKEPDWFLDWKIEASKDYYLIFDDLRSEVKAKLKESLIKEQGYLCCYCGIKITKLDESHIEHFKPQSQYNNLRLDYNNLFISCTQNSLSKHLIHCGHAKGNKYDDNLSISPLDNDCETKFIFNLNGNITSLDESGLYMIKLLNLNSKVLIDRRKYVINKLLPLNILDSLTIEEMYKLRDFYQIRDANGEFAEFRQAITNIIDFFITK